MRCLGSGRPSRPSPGSAPPRPLPRPRRTALGRRDRAVAPLARALKACRRCASSSARMGPLVEQLQAAGISGRGAAALSPTPRPPQGHRRVGIARPSSAHGASAIHPATPAPDPRTGPDIVHTNSLKAALYGGVAGRLAGVPTVWHIRDRSPPTTCRAGGPARASSRPSPADRRHRQFARDDEHAAGTVARERALQPDPPDTVDCKPSAQAGQDGRLTIGMVGRLTPWKGQDVFLDAFADAFRGEDVRARVVGSALFGEDAYAAALEGEGEQLSASTSRSSSAASARTCSRNSASLTSSSTARYARSRSARSSSKGWWRGCRSSPRTPAAPLN